MPCFCTVKCRTTTAIMIASPFAKRLPSTIYNHSPCNLRNYAKSQQIDMPNIIHGFTSSNTILGDALRYLTGSLCGTTRTLLSFLRYDIKQAFLRNQRFAVKPGTPPSPLTHVDKLNKSGQRRNQRESLYMGLDMHCESRVIVAPATAKPSVCPAFIRTSQD